MEKQPIDKLTFEDLAKFSESNSQIIWEALTNNEMFRNNDPGIEKTYQELLNKMMANASIAITSLAPLRQTQPTRFRFLFVQAILAASEQVKCDLASSLHNYNLDSDIKNTRAIVESALAAELKTEMVLWALLSKKEYSQALIIINALEIERQDKDVILRLEVLNWKMEVLSKLGDEQGFFEALTKAFQICSEHPEDQLRYDSASAKNVIEYILAKKMSAGIPIIFNDFGKAKMFSNPKFPSLVGQEFQNLLVDKIIDGIFKNRRITDIKSFNEFVDTEWDNIVSSFKLINPFVETIVKLRNFK